MATARQTPNARKLTAVNTMLCPDGRLYEYIIHSIGFRLLTSVAEASAAFTASAAADGAVNTAPVLLAVDERAVEEVWLDPLAGGYRWHVAAQ